MRAICLHEHKIDHIAHLCPAQAAGIGTLLGLKPDVIYQAVQQAVHVSFTTRQSRKGEISSWKAYAPAHAGKLAIEAVDRAMRGEGAPSPVYEGEDSVIAWMLDGQGRAVQRAAAGPKEPKRAIMDSYTKEHSAEYQSQALIDLAFRMREQIADTRRSRDRHPHQPPHALRDRHRRQRPAEDGPEGQPRDAGPLDHVHLRRGPAGRRWHHVDSYAPKRAGRHDTVELWHKIETREDAGLDPALPLARPERARVRRAGRDHHEGRPR